KHGGRDRRTWRKLHLAIDPDTGEVLASALTTTEEGDASLVRPLLDQIAAPIAAVLADGAYDGDPVYQAVADRAPAATVIIPPRATAMVSEVSAAGAPTPRDRHIEMIAAKGRLGWQKAVGYGRRSLVETGMLRYKTIIGRTLRARTARRCCAFHRASSWTSRLFSIAAGRSAMTSSRHIMMRQKRCCTCAASTSSPIRSASSRASSGLRRTGAAHRCRSASHRAFSTIRGRRCASTASLR